MSLPSLPPDKANHFVYGAVIYAVTFCIFSLLKLPAATYYAFATVALFGVGKEIVDYLQNRFQGAQHGVEALDALATIAGGAICAIPVFMKG
jgi:hypothetical protein